MIIFISFNISAYDDFGITDVVIPNTVRANSDFNITVVVSSNSTGSADYDLNIYRPTGGAPFYTANGSLSDGDNLITINGADINYSNQPYMLRIFLTDTDDNPSNNLFSKYFTVIKSSTKVPVSDLPLFSGIIIAMLFLFILSFNSSKKNISKKNKK